MLDEELSEAPCFPLQNLLCKCTLLHRCAL